MARFGGLPFAAFPKGKLPGGWWQSPKLEKALGAWRQSVLSYTVTLPLPQRPSPQAVVSLLMCRDEDGQPPYPRETMAVARDVLEEAARASGPRTSVEQWVLRQGWGDPMKVLDPAWASRLDAGPPF